MTMFDKQNLDSSESGSRPSSLPQGSVIAAGESFSNKTAMTLDKTEDFNRILSAAVQLGISEATAGMDKMKTSSLIKQLVYRFGVFHYRNFHSEILIRAYGMAFINREKMVYVHKLNKQAPNSI